jgi:hypothetical protein
VILLVLVLYYRAAAAIIKIVNCRSPIECYSEKIAFLFGIELFLLSNYLWKYNNLYVDVLWIFPLALIIIHSGSWAFFLKRSASPIAIFLFFSIFGINWFPVKGAGIFFAEILMLIFLPFVTIDLLARNLNITGCAGDRSHIYDP